MGQHPDSSNSQNSVLKSPGASDRRDAGAGLRRTAESGSGPWRRRLTVAACVFLILGAGLALRAELLEPEPTTVDSEGPLPVAVTSVVITPGFESFERLSGRVVSRRRSDLGFERSGRLAKVRVDTGDSVKAGDLLAELDQRELRAARREQKARLASTRSRLELAKITAARQRKLRDSEYLSPQALDEAIANEASLEADLVAGQAAVERTDVAIALSRLVAPYDAIVVARTLDEGTVAGPGQTVLSLLESGVQEVQLGVPPSLAASFEIGRAYEVESQTAGAAGPREKGVKRMAKLVRWVPALDPATRTQTAILEMETPGDAVTAPAARLAEGSLATVRIARQVPSRGAWVPMSALAEGRRGTWTAFAVKQDEAGDWIADRRVVEIIQTEGDRAFVRGTLADGDQIVVDGLHRLIPGVRVSLRSAAPTDSAQPAS